MGGDGRWPERRKDKRGLRHCASVPGASACRVTSVPDRAIGARTERRFPGGIAEIKAGGVVVSIYKQPTSPCLIANHPPFPLPVPSATHMYHHPYPSQPPAQYQNAEYSHHPQPPVQPHPSRERDERDSHQHSSSRTIGDPLSFADGQFSGQLIRAQLTELQKADLGRKCVCFPLGSLPHS